jgi:hypothetical protein
MRFLNLGVLPRHNVLHRRSEAVIKRFSVFFDRGIFAALAFSQYGMVIAFGDSGFQIDPAAMQCAGGAATHFRLSVIGTLGFAAQLDREARALLEILAEQ